MHDQQHIKKDFQYIMSAIYVLKIMVCNDMTTGSCPIPLL